MKKTLHYVFVSSLICTVSYAGVITHTDYTAGAVITAAGQNANENTIVNEINGNLEDTNIKVGGVSSSNLATSLNLTGTTTISRAAITNVTVSSNVAVGTTTTPTYALDTLGDIRALSTGTGAIRGVISEQVSNDAASGHHAGLKARGTPGALAIVQPGDYVASLVAMPYDGATFTNVGEAVYQVSPSSTAALGRTPVDFVIGTSSNTGHGFERIRVRYDGIVQINTPADANGTLTVLGKSGTNAGRFEGADNTFATLYATNSGTEAAATLDGASTVLAVSGAGAPANSFALCFLNGKLGHCSSAVGAGGGCTCSQP